MRYYQDHDISYLKMLWDITRIMISHIVFHHLNFFYFILLQYLSGADSWDVTAITDGPLDFVIPALGALRPVCRASWLPYSTDSYFHGFVFVFVSWHVMTNPKWQIWNTQKGNLLMSGPLKIRPANVRPAMFDHSYHFSKF